MPRTPDRYPGTRFEEGIVFDNTISPSQAGEVRYSSGDFLLQDSIGVYNPREVFPAPTEEGVLIYSDDGITFEQVVPLVGDGILVSSTGKIVYEG